MNLEELLKREIEKRFGTLEEIARGGEPEGRLEEALICLHTLKGDLSHLDDQSVLEGLGELRKVWTDRTREEKGQNLLERITRLKKKALALTFQESGGEASEQIRSWLFKIVQNVCGELKKECVLKFECEIDRLDERSLLLIKDMLAPLLLNSCVHGVGESGEIRVALKADGESISIQVSDPGEGSRPATAKDEKNLFSGEGIGLGELERKVSALSGIMTIDQGEGFSVTIFIRKGGAAQ